MIKVEWKYAPRGTTHALLNPAGEVVFARETAAGFAEPRRGGRHMNTSASGWQVLRTKPKGHVQYALDLRTGMDLYQWLDANASKHTIIEAAEAIGYGSPSALRMWLTGQQRTWSFRPDKAGGKPFYNTKLTLSKLKHASNLHATGAYTWEDLAMMFEASSVGLRQAIYRNRKRGLLPEKQNAKRAEVSPEEKVRKSRRRPYRGPEPGSTIEQQRPAGAVPTL